MEKIWTRKEPQKVWVVYDAWHSGSEWADDWYNNDMEITAGVFSAEEKAIDYILDRLREDDERYAEDQKENDITLPSRSKIQADHGAEYFDGTPGGSELRYEMFIVDYKEDK